MSDSYATAHRYKIIFRYKTSFDPIDYVFLAADEIHAAALILPFSKEYNIEHVWKFNKDKKRYFPCKTLEDRYVKKQ